MKKQSKQKLKPEIKKPDSSVKWHGTPDFQSIDERDTYFRENADYFTLVKKGDVGHYARDECKSLVEVEALAKTKIAIGGGNYMIYAVIGEQSAFVRAVK